MRLTTLLFAAITLGSATAHAALVDKPLSVSIGDTEFAGVLGCDDAKPAKRSLLTVRN